jgi:hypothetical protein
MYNVQKDESAESRVVVKGNRGFALRLHKLPGLTNVSAHLILCRTLPCMHNITGRRLYLCITISQEVKLSTTNMQNYPKRDGCPDSRHRELKVSNQYSILTR